jgi:hypothetical protein
MRPLTGMVSVPRAYAALTMAGRSGRNARTWSKRSVRTVFRKAPSQSESPFESRGRGIAASDPGLIKAA